MQKRNKRIKKYKSRDGARGLSDKQAQVYGSEIAELMESKGGKLTPYEVLIEAKKKNSVLHRFFEWNNTKAAEEYRLSQARYLMRQIVEVVVFDHTETEQRSFFSVTDKKTNTAVYVTVRTATSVKDYRKELIDRIITHLDNTTSLLKMFKNYD